MTPDLAAADQPSMELADLLARLHTFCEAFEWSANWPEEVCRACASNPEPLMYADLQQLMEYARVCGGGLLAAVRDGERRGVAAAREAVAVALPFEHPTRGGTFYQECRLAALAAIDALEEGRSDDNG